MNAILSENIRMCSYLLVSFLFLFKVSESLSLIAKIHYLKGDRSLAIKTKKAAIKALKDRDFETDKELVHDWKQELLAM